MKNTHQSRVNGGTFFNASMCLTIINLIERERLVIGDGFSRESRDILSAQLDRVREAIDKEMDYVHTTK